MIEKVHEVNDAASNMAAIMEEQSASAEKIEATAVSIQELAEGTYFQVYDLELAEEVLSYYSVDRDSD